MKTILKIMLGGMCYFFQFAVQAQKPVSLDSILAIIQERSPLLHSFTARAEAMSAYSQAAAGWMAPEVGGGLWMVPYKRVTDQRDKGQIMISVQQKLINPAKTRAARDYQASKVLIEEEKRSQVFNELRSRAKLSYAQWIAFEKKKQVLTATRNAIQGIREIAESRIPFNQSKLSQVYKAEARIQEVENLILENDNLIEQQNILINQLMNDQTGSKFRIDTTWQPEVKKPLADASLAGERSDIRRVEKTIQSLRLSQELERVQSRPDFNLSFNHMIARSSGMPNQFMLLGMVSIPIAPWSSKSYINNSIAIGREIDAMQNEKQNILTEASSKATGLNADIATLQKQTENYRLKIIPALQRSYETITNGYRENTEELTDVLDALDALNVMRLEFLERVLKLNEKIIALEKELN